MNVNEVIHRLDNAIHQLLEREHNILKRGLNELNLNGHLTKYLSPLFDEYDVDPEYNGDIAKIHDRKELDIANNRMREIGINPSHDDRYKLTPDIIIHTRNTNDNNLLALEIKKDSNSAKNKEFDLLKLEHMTIDYQGNHYNYKLGAALVFGTKDKAGDYTIRFFQNGIECDREYLK
ncbi:hypothetical protein [Pedobacter sp. UC225_65]|uniref:hypothetical protein n=1 Tax=Pedobacter sp. UC225_65 TaxID=3350173 RepID=UPI00366BE1B9